MATSSDGKPPSVSQCQLLHEGIVLTDDKVNVWLGVVYQHIVSSSLANEVVVFEGGLLNMQFFFAVFLNVRCANI